MRLQVNTISAFALTSLFALFPSGAIGHDNGAKMPPILAERMITLLEDGRKAGVFQAPLPAGCLPEACLSALIAALGPEDIEWLDTSPEAALPSRYFERVPASILIRFLHDLSGVLHDANPARTGTAQGKRLQRMFLEWSE